MEKIIACLCVDDSDPIEGKIVLQKKERIINPNYLNRIWELVWNFATMWNGFCGEIFDFNIGKLQMPSNPTHLLFYTCRLFLAIWWELLKPHTHQFSTVVTAFIFKSGNVLTEDRYQISLIYPSLSELALF